MVVVQSIICVKEGYVKKVYLILMLMIITLLIIIVTTNLTFRSKVKTHQEGVEKFISDSERSEDKDSWLNPKDSFLKPKTDYLKPKTDYLKPKTDYLKPSPYLMINPK